MGNINNSLSPDNVISQTWVVKKSIRDKGYDGINVRSGPGIEYNVVATLNIGDRFDIFEEKNGCLRTKYGWVKIKHKGTTFIEYKRTNFTKTTHKSSGSISKCKRCKTRFGTNNLNRCGDICDLCAE